MMFRKLTSVLIGVLIIFQIITSFIFMPSVMAITGCLIILISAIQWELKGGIYSATFCSLIMLTAYFIAVLQTNNWLLILITIILYYAMGVGIGGIIGKIRKQRLNLELSEARYSQLSEQSRTFTWEVDEQGLFTYVDHMVEVVTGYRSEELVYKKHFYELCPEEDRETLKQAAFDIFSRKESFLNLEHKELKKNGHIVWLSTNGIPILKDDGTLQGFNGSNTDITTRKQAELDLKKSEEKYVSYIENAPDGVFISDENGWYIEANRAASDITGYSNEELLHISISDMMPEESLEAGMKHFKRLLETGKSTGSMKFKHKDGTIGWWSIDAVKLSEHRFMGFVKDITDRKRLETELLDEKNLLKITLKSVGDGVISTDSKGNIVYLNSVAEILTGWTQEEARGKPVEEVFNIVDEFTKIKRESIVKEVIEGGKQLELVNHTVLISKAGIEYPIEDSAAPIMQENGKIVGVVLVFRDFSEKKKKQEKIEFLSYHDQLTGLYNRRFYEEELKRLDTKRNFPLSIVMGDVNGLKLINDSLGHEMGDELLKKAAEVIIKGCRADDIIARLGGDEFVIILPKTDDLETEQIIKRINEFSLKAKKDYMDISISFGYKTKNDEKEKIQDIFKYAEDMMYRNKLSKSSIMNVKTVDVIMKTLFKKYKREQSHSIKVSEICEVIATKMDFNEHDISQIRTAGLMHDIGKIDIDGEILNKAQKLNEDDLNEIKRHPEKGYRILRLVDQFSEIAKYVLQHHERWDGTGYPRGLKGEEICLPARIIALADSYDAMTSNRLYVKALSKEEAINEIRRCSGTQFDPEIVEMFIENIGY